MNVKKIIVITILLIVLIMPINRVYATTLQDLYNNLASLEKSYNAAKNKANMTQAELNSVKASIKTIENEVKQAQSEIIKAEKDIEESEEKVKKKKEETNQMLLYLQLTSSNGDNLLEYVFDADNYTDLIYRYSVVSQMSEANKKLTDELNQLIKELNAKKADLNKKQETLAEKKKDLEAKYLIVQAQYEDEQEEGLSVSAQISEKKKLIKYYESIGCTKSQNINSCGRTTSSGGGKSNGNAVAAANGWKYPLSHFVQTSIYAESRGSKNHYAVDLGVGEGSAVLAVYDGTVISAHVGSGGCGGMIVQILHNYNGSNYVSLYMHLIDSYVSIGTKVSAGQTIGTSGGGPKEIAKWGDKCTEGAHLHFAMATGSDLIGSSSNKGSTFDPVRFFPAMRGYGATL